MERPGSVILYASQIAACIGYNRHKKPSECLEHQWERTAPDSYRQALLRNGCLTEAERLDQLIRQHEIMSTVLDTSLKSCRSSEDVAITYDSVSKKIRELSKSLHVSDDDQAMLDATAKRNLYTTYGTASESEALQRIESSLGLVARPDDMFYKMCIGQVDGVDIFVGGKIDAITQDRSLVIEIKNRIRRLFYKVPFYEVIQLQTYLQLLGVDRGVIVECLNITDPNIATMNVLPVQRDRDLWTSIIVPKMKEYTRVFIELTTSIRFQDEFLRATPTKRQALVMSRMRRTHTHY